MSAGLVQVRLRRPALGLHRAAGVLALGSLAWLLLFHAEAQAALVVWLQSTAYGHCFLVLPVAAWLAWERRGALAGLAAEPLPWVAVAALVPELVWLAAERVGIMEGRQLAAMSLLLLLALAVLGRRISRAMAVPLLYLFFLVPFGGFLVAPLQIFTADFIDVGLDLLGIAHVVTRTIIEIPEGTFHVAEACAGLRFLIAAIAFGVVYACTIYRSAWRRVAFIAAATVVPVIANGFRALGIVVLGHLLGSAEAGAVDHILYGWLFFSIVIVLLILGGLPFRDDAQHPASAIPLPGAAVPAWTVLGIAAAAVLVVAALGPAAAMALDQRAASQQARLGTNPVSSVLARLTAPPGCQPRGPARFECGGVAITAAAQAFAPASSPASLFAAIRAASETDGTEEAHPSIWTLAAGQPRQWQVTELDSTNRVVAAGFVVGGAWRLAGFWLRVHQAAASVIGGRAVPVLLTIKAAAGHDRPIALPRDSLRSFLGHQALLRGGPSDTHPGPS